MPKHGGRFMGKRTSGILLHLTSLPSKFGIGDMGPEARRFIDFLADARQTIWQILPLNPVEAAHGASPYHGVSSDAGNPLLISPEILMEEGLLTPSEIEPLPGFPADRVDYPSVIRYKEKLFDIAYERFRNAPKNGAFPNFCMRNADWLEDAALFHGLKSLFSGRSWDDWPAEIRNRNPESLREAAGELAQVLERFRFIQFLFARQWENLKKYCNRQGVEIIGDIPIYVPFDCVEVWMNPGLFKLDANLAPTVVTGVPPDYFSATGQLWGHPVYRWDVLQEGGYAWWVRRIGRQLARLDRLRIDHFRGFVAYWEVPADEKTAVNGKWVEAPADDFFRLLRRKFRELPIIAEDLGTITPDVREIMDRFGFPGMRVLLFAFGDDLPANPYAPHNLIRNCVVYTGTHDNNTVRGWFEKEADRRMRSRFLRYLGRRVSAEEAPLEMIRLAMMSVAETAVFPLQDILALGEDARMNRPSSSTGNWEWRYMPDQLTSSVRNRLRHATELYGRT